MYQPPEPTMWPTDLPRPSVEQIKSAVLIGMRCPFDDALESKRRHAAAVLCRRMCALLCQRIRGMSTPEVAIALGTSSHTAYTRNGDWLCEFCHSIAGTAAYNEIVKTLMEEIKSRRDTEENPYRDAARAALSNHAGGQA